MMKYCFKLVGFSLFFGIVSCGGGGSSGGSGVDDSEFVLSIYSGSQSPSTVTEANKENAAESAIVGSEKAISDAVGASLSDTNPFFKQSNSANTLTIVEDSYYEVTSNKIRETVDCDYGGTMVISSNDISENLNSLPSSGQLNMSLDTCDLIGGFTADGRIQISWSGGWDIYDERGPRNYVVSFNLTALGETESGLLSCENFGESCDVSVDFEENGQHYRVQNPVVNGSNVSGYAVDARIYNQDLGYLDISASGLMLCPAAGFSSGLISVVDSSNTEILMLNFIDCNTYRMIFNGNTELLSQ